MIISYFRTTNGILVFSSLILVFVDISLLVMYTSIFILVHEGGEGGLQQYCHLRAQCLYGSQGANVVFTLCSRQLIGTGWESGLMS